MIGHLYRYPHPVDNTRFIYVGQGAKRDIDHRMGVSSFGKRFRKTFPEQELPQPIRWTVEIANRQELNEEETIAMFQYHTWYGLGGLNLTLPGSTDYIKLAHLGGITGGAIGGRATNATTNGRKSNGGRIGGRIGGPIGIRKMKREDQVRGGKGASHEDKVRAGKIGGKIGGKMGNVESKRKNGRISAKRNNCKHWNVDRGKPCICGEHKSDI